jgi:hypothetical protein
MIKGKLFWIVVCAEALVCFAVWRSVPNAKVRASDLLGWGSAAFLAALVLAMFSESRKWMVVAGTIAAPLAANIANICYDLAKDSTSHNLFPFELIMTLVATGIAALIGAVIGTGLHRKGSRDAASQSRS